MMTLQELRNSFDQDRDAYRARRQEIRSYADALFTLYHARYDNNDTPTTTVQKLVDQIGRGPAAMILASIVNGVGEWDTRVGQTARQWAASVPDALDADAVQNMWISTDEVHRAHLDQMARAMAKI